MLVMTELEVVRHALCERLLSYLDDLPFALREDVIEALEVEGKLLHQPPAALDGRWALLPFCLTSDLHAGADPDQVCRVALAMECIICATDLFDEIMDEDVTPLLERLGLARVLNAAFALTSLAQRILLSLVDAGFEATLPARLLDTVQRALLLASAGQQQDLLAERRMACDLTREECIEIAAAKAGALLSLACRMGAMCAGVEEAEVEQCAEMGRLLGIAAQLDNDAHDLSSLLQPAARPAHGQKSDLARGKKTLPVVLAAHSLRTAQALDATSIDAAFQQITSLADSTREARALREGILVTWGLALLYRERAREYLDMISHKTPPSLALRQVLGLTQ